MQGGSLKLSAWNKKNVVKVAITYFLNVILMFLMFIAMAAINGASQGKNLEEQLKSFATLFDFAVLLVIMIAVTFIYFFFEDRDFLKSAANSEMLFLIMELGVIITYACGKYINPYIRPLALVAILTLFLSGSKDSVFVNFIFVILMFLYDSFTGNIEGYDAFDTVFFVATGLAAGVIASYSMKGLYSRLKIMLMSLLVSIPSLVSFVLPGVAFGDGKTIANIAAGVLSGPLATAIFIVLLPIFEGLFKKATCFKLAELTDHKAKLIRKLITKAPGTFNHSIIVSNIAEACATAIGEDALLARTCAYYHDVGKLRRPEFFKENQAEQDNPHNDLTPELSANIIKSHTQDGYALALKSGIPKEIADKCLEHHGTMPILFFYDKAKKFTDGEVPLANFCYSGPKPQSKISAIIMIADGSEAATRTLKDRTRENVTKAVKKIVSDRMQLGQFDECEITLKELNIIIHTVVNSLTGVYHNRVEYPKVSLEGLDIDDDKDER